MPWEALSIVELREEFCRLALSGAVPVRELCRRFGISPTTAYKWLGRSVSGEPLSDRSRRPLSSPARCPEETESRVLALRGEHPSWGARKLRRLLEREGMESVPSASTITEILRRSGLLGQAPFRGPFERFERESPNLLWQMDFKGPLTLQAGRASVLGVLDDHSRYNLVLASSADQRTGSVVSLLEGAFRLYGLPQAILCDNGPPWGSCSEHEMSPLSVWLLLRGVRVLHGRAYHPQTQGKQERFFGTLERDLLRWRSFADAEELDRALGAFRGTYNLVRPHDALGGRTPAEAYRPSPVPYPERLPEPEYDEGFLVRKVFAPGRVGLKGTQRSVPKALVGMRVGLKEVEDGAWGVFLGPHIVFRLQPEHNE